MFALFVSLYYSLFTGSWVEPFSNPTSYKTLLQPIIDGIGNFLTSIFGDTQPMTNLGEVLLTPASLGSTSYNSLLFLLSFILALITSIGIVVMAIKGIKRVFGVFFMGIRNI